jgi:hypothetical protein
MIPVELLQEIRRNRIKENGGGRKFKYDIFDTFYNPV